MIAMHSDLSGLIAFKGCTLMFLNPSNECLYMNDYGNGHQLWNMNIVCIGQCLDKTRFVLLLITRKGITEPP